MKPGEPHTPTAGRQPHKEGNPGGVMLGEISQTQKDKFCTISPTSGVRASQSPDAGRRGGSPGAGGRGRGGCHRWDSPP